MRRDQMPPIDFTWLTRPGEAQFVERGIQDWLPDIVGGVLLALLVACGIVFLIGLAGWASARSGTGLGGKDQSFWAGRAGLALIAAACIASLAAAMRWGIATFQPGQWGF